MPLGCCSRLGSLALFDLLGEFACSGADVWGLGSAQTQWSVDQVSKDEWDRACYVLLHWYGIEVQFVEGTALRYSNEQVDHLAWYVSAQRTCPVSGLGFVVFESICFLQQIPRYVLRYTCHLYYWQCRKVFQK